MSYETWRGLHVALALGAVGLAFGHVIAISRFTQTGTIRWLTLGFVVAALVAAFYLRVGRQFLASRRPYRLAGSATEPDGSVTLSFEAVDHGGAPFVPGQFAWIKHAGSPYALTEHPFSYASSALEPDRPGFTVKPAGDFTAALGELRDGERMLIDGPHGSPAVPDERDAVLIAGGSGITPSLSVLRTAAAEGDGRRFLLLYLNRDPADFGFAAELEELHTRLRLDVVTIPSRPPDSWQGPSGRIRREVLDDLLPADRSEWSYFVCGSPAMTDTAVRALADLGIPRGAIRAERFELA
jgi:predicted ferric reductase